MNLINYMKNLKPLNKYHKGTSMFLTRYTPKKYKSGFTLIELMVVIAIISLLSSVVLASVKDARERASTSAFRTNVNQFITALELYKADKGFYPGQQSVDSAFGYITKIYTNGTLALPTVTPSVPGFASYGDYENALIPYIKSLPDILDLPKNPGKVIEFRYNHSPTNTLTARCYGETRFAQYVILISSVVPGFEDWPYSTVTGSSPYKTYRCFSL